MPLDIINLIEGLATGYNTDQLRTRKSAEELFIEQLKQQGELQKIQLREGLVTDRTREEISSRESISATDNLIKMLLGDQASADKRYTAEQNLAGKLGAANINLEGRKYTADRGLEGRLGSASLQATARVKVQELKNERDSEGYYADLMKSNPELGLSAETLMSTGMSAPAAFRFAAVTDLARKVKSLGLGKQLEEKLLTSGVTRDLLDEAINVGIPEALRKQFPEDDENKLSVRLLRMDKEEIDALKGIALSDPEIRGSIIESFNAMKKGVIQQNPDIDWNKVLKEAEADFLSETLGAQPRGPEAVIPPTLNQVIDSSPVWSDEQKDQLRAIAASEYAAGKSWEEIQILILQRTISKMNEMQTQQTAPSIPNAGIQ